MNKWSDTSRERLLSCHPDIIRIFNEVLPHFDCTVVEGHRPVERQQQLYAQGRTEPGPIVTKVDGVNIKSKHNYQPSRAIDVVPFPIDWHDTGRMYYFAGFVMATAQRLYDQGHIQHRLRFGGDWDMDTEVDDHTFMDLPHFELID